MPKIKYFILILACIFLLNTAQAKAAMVTSSDQTGGYSNSVLDAVVKKWRPPLDGKERTVRVLVMIDGDGKLEECSPLNDSTLNEVTAAEKAACDAVRDIGTFAKPPYGLPMDVFLSFWVGEVDGANALPPPDGPPVKHASTNPPKQAKSEFIDSKAFTSQNKPEQSTSKLTPPSDASIDKTTESQDKPLVASRTTPPTIHDNRGGAVLDEDDFYVKMVMRKIGPHVQFPPDLPAKELSTSVTVQVDASGNIKDVQLIQPSGHEDLDSAIIKATEKTGKVNPPPDKKARELFLTFIIKA